MVTHTSFPRMQIRRVGALALVKACAGLGKLTHLLLDDNFLSGDGERYTPHHSTAQRAHCSPRLGACMHHAGLRRCAGTPADWMRFLCVQHKTR